MKCPVCGSTRVGKIIYGLPDFTEELMQRCDNEEVYLGGCIIFDGYPEGHCFACNHNIASMPVLQKKDKSGLEDIRRLVTAIRLDDDGYPRINIEKKKDEILLEVRPAGEELNCPAGDSPQASFTRRMTEEEWKELLEVLYTELYLHEWPRFSASRHFPEGERWELEVKLTEDRVMNYLGIGAFPPYWEELKAVFKPFYESLPESQPQESQPQRSR